MLTIKGYLVSELSIWTPSLTGEKSMHIFDRLAQEDLSVLGTVAGAAIIGIVVTIAIILWKPDATLQAFGIGFSITGIMVALKGVLSKS